MCYCEQDPFLPTKVLAECSDLLRNPNVLAKYHPTLIDDLILKASSSSFLQWNTFSGGQKKRLQLFYTLRDEKRKILLLDEPTSGLDPQRIASFVDTIRP